ncbi:hypothetical protein PMAN_a0660 [Pseudoalteromonas marina]|nr:hypothetical protein PMAN_a0660 [Pseudoalteromonas marina]
MQPWHNLPKEINLFSFLQNDTSCVVFHFKSFDYKKYNHSIINGLFIALFKLSQFFGDGYGYQF